MNKRERFGNAPPRAEGSSPFARFRGVTYTPWVHNVLFSRVSDRSIQQMKEIGVDTVGLNIHWYQDQPTSHVIKPDHARISPSESSVRHAIRHIHEQGMRVFLYPRLNILEGNIWRGFILPSKAWFDAYREFISGWAEVSAEEGVDLLSIGGEFRATEEWEDEWREIAGEVRSIWNGPLVYGANHDSYETIKWWDALDYVGISAYWAVTESANPTLTELYRGWNGRREQLQAWREQRGLRQPILFTSIGYRSCSGTMQRPWHAFQQHTGGPDLQAQAHAYEAALATMWDDPSWAGAFWWNWETDPLNLPENTNFSPQNKPAARVLHEYYQRPAPVLHHKGG